jgi:hypothetical protein
MYHLHDTHDYALRHLNLASEGMKSHYDRLANPAGYQEGDKIWICRPTRT